jgi:DNA replication protein DnaC
MEELETTGAVPLEHHLKALRPPTTTAGCEEVARRRAAEDVDHLGSLLRLCELELIGRERRSARRRLEAARLPTAKTLEAFDFASAPTLNEPLVPELARCESVERREDPLLVGGPGTGRTHLATALASRRAAGAGASAPTG